MAADEDVHSYSGSEGTALESGMNQQMGNFIHLFLSILAMLVMAAACVAVAMAVYRDFPVLWSPANLYDSLHHVLQDMLLIAIAAELALLLLFHRASAAVEVVMFVISRRMVATDVTAFDLLIGSIALIGLLIVRFYYLPGKPK